MAWIALFVAGLLEIVWAYFMKLSDGFSRPAPTIATFVFMFASFALLAWAMKQLPLGTSYMIWTGIGAVGAFLVGVVVLGESLSLMRIAAAGLIVAGIAMMKLATP
jgi:quaternary ammonium compound-resistance protein SugE